MTPLFIVFTKHIFHKYSIPTGRVVYKHMGYNAHKLSLLDNGTA